MSLESRWQPILEGELAARALETVCAIGEALGTPRPKASPPLAHGLAGQALLQAYLAGAGLEGGTFESAKMLLDLAIVGLEERVLPPDLFSGFLGIAWVTEILLEGTVSAEEDPNEEIDEVLGALVERSPWRGDYDLISGLVGFGVYALKRLPRPSAARCLQEIVARLHELAEAKEPGFFAWLTRPELMGPENRKLHPRGVYNLGVAHGVPGVIALLAKVCAAGVALETARPLLDGAVRWLLAQRQPENAESTFPYYLDEHLSSLQTGRSAWCYGDPGVAACLFQAARSRVDEEGEQAALTVARVAARLPYEEAGVADAGLCHGAAGLGHIYNRFFQATGEEVFLDAARSWLRRTLDMRETGVGVAGYRSWSVGDDLELQWVDDPAFLTGAAGIGLALAAGVSRTEPTWDGALLLDFPP